MAQAVAADPWLDRAALRAHSQPVVDWAIDQGVTGLLQNSAGGDLAEPAATRLADAALADAGRHLGVIVTLERLGNALQGGPFAVVKGPVLGETSYAGIPRPYFDLDLLVPPSQFGSALEQLEAAGALLIDRNWDLLMREGRAQVSLKDSATSLTIDLHWHLVNPARQRQTFAISTDELLERRGTVLLHSVRAPALEVTDRLIHYAVHAATSGGHRLVWLADLSRTMDTDPPDWDELVRRSRAWRVDLPVAVMLARAEATLGVGPPAGVVSDLAGDPVRRRLIRRLAVWEPGGRLPGGGSIRHGITESLGGSLPATARLTAANGAAMVRRFWDRYPHWLDPDDPAHIEHDSGGTVGRERYLAAVGAGRL